MMVFVFLDLVAGAKVLRGLLKFFLLRWGWNVFLRNELLRMLAEAKELLQARGQRLFAELSPRFYAVSSSEALFPMETII